MKKKICVVSNRYSSTTNNDNNIFDVKIMIKLIVLIV